MAKKAKESKINKRPIVIAVVAAAIVLIVLVLLLNPSLTGNAISCSTGNSILSIHVDGNKDGYIAPINRAKISLRPVDSACVYSVETNENGDVNLKVNPGKYRASIIKTGKCASHSEDIIVTSSALVNFRLESCTRNFEI